MASMPHAPFLALGQTLLFDCGTYSLESLEPVLESPPWDAWQLLKGLPVTKELRTILYPSHSISVERALVVIFEVLSSLQSPTERATQGIEAQGSRIQKLAAPPVDSSDEERISHQWSPHRFSVLGTPQGSLEQASPIFSQNSWISIGWFLVSCSFCDAPEVHPGWWHSTEGSWTGTEQNHLPLSVDDTLVACILTGSLVL